MKLRWLPFVALCLAAAFITGVRHGSIAETDLQFERQGVQARLNTTIAIVNADTGVILDGNRYNYSAAIINTLGEDFVLVSPAMAQTGFANGMYGAVVTFPPDVSTRILSFNAVQPERVHLNFLINENLPERDYLEVFIAITGLQHSINTTLANTYVSSILRQFHEAQDQVEGVFNNNLSDLMALEVIRLNDFTASLELDEVPYIPLNPRELDTQFYMEQVLMFANDVAGWYLHSFEAASDQYLWMREGLFALTEDFPEQENEWMEMLSEWTRYSEEFGELLEVYSSYVRRHDEALEAWHLANVAWNEGLVNYYRQVSDWHGVSDIWFDNAEVWYASYTDYLKQVLDYFEALTTYRTELEDSLTPVMEDLTAWLNTLQDYETNLTTIFDNLTETVEIYNIQTELSNEFLEALLYWHTDLYYHRQSLMYWREMVDYRIETLLEWQEDLGYAQYDLIYFFGIFDDIKYDLLAMPELDLSYIIALDPNIANALLTIPDAPPDLSDMPLLPLYPSVSTIPAPNPAGFSIHNIIPPPTPQVQFIQVPDGFGGFLTFQYMNHFTIQSIFDFYNILVTYFGKMETWHGETELIATTINTWINEYNINFYPGMTAFLTNLTDSYNKIYEWHTNMLAFDYYITSKYTILSLFADEMAYWHYPLFTFFNDELYLIELPDFDLDAEWEAIEFPYDYEIPLPDYVEPIELVTLPEWIDGLTAPAPYDGASIAEVFTQEFPLDRNAVNAPMGLERMTEFADYTVPYIVGEHEHFMAMQPLSPLKDAPPRPHGFWSNLEHMHGQLSSFEIGDFLSYDIHRQVDASILSYGHFLESVREDINFLFEDNIWLMHDLHAEYNFFLLGLRHDALSANHEEQAALQNTIDEFSSIVGSNSEDTRDRLGFFASMIPESRTAAGINQSLVNFTVAPFDVTQLAIRDEIPVSSIFIEPVSETYQWVQNVILISALSVLALTTAGNFVHSYYKKKKLKEV